MAIELNQAQADFMNATERLVAFVAGYGAGKTFISLLKILQLASINAGFDGAYVAPTYKMAEDLGFRDCMALCDSLGIEYKANKAKLKLEVWMGETPKWTLIHFLSGDKPDSLKGLNLAWALVDEAGMCDEAVWKQLLARVRVKKAPLNQLIVVGTPEGGPGTWFGQVAEFGADGVKADRLIRARTHDNPHLPPEYIEDMRSRYTPDEFRGYCEGYFVASGGQVYRWDSKSMVRPFTDPYQHEGQLQVYADFNVVKVVWLLAWQHKGVVHVFDEVVSENTYTNEQGIKVKERIRKWGLDPEGVHLYHDSNTSKRSASATRDGTGTSDVLEVRQLGFKPKYRNQNPPVRDRVASVNKKLQDGALFVDTRCTELTKSLSTQGRDKAGNPDKSGGLDHAVDALGYGIFYQWPYAHRKTPGPTSYH